MFSIFAPEIVNRRENPPSDARESGGNPGLYLQL